MVKWPNGKSFAFTIVDDTDEATVNNVKPIYDLLYELGIKTTKTVWAFPSRDEFSGDTLADENYAQFIKELSDKGYEIAFHGAGSGAFTGEETVLSQEIIKNLIGYYPRLYINHANNIGNLYWNHKRFSFPFDKLFILAKRVLGNEMIVSQGEVEESPYFWGDFAKEHIQFIRNRTFSGINTIKYDNKMPYRNKKNEKFSNYWFSSSDAYNCISFKELLSKKNVDKLIKQNGCAIIYTHFAYGFVMEDGTIDPEFIECIRYISGKNGWFVPASKILDYININRNADVYISNLQKIYLDTIWFAERIIRKLIRGE